MLSIFIVSRSGENEFKYMDITFVSFPNSALSNRTDFDETVTKIVNEFSGVFLG